MYVIHVCILFFDKAKKIGNKIFMYKKKQKIMRKRNQNFMFKCIDKKQ